MTLEAFEQRYPPHPPDREPDNEDQLRLLGDHHGVRSLRSPPAETPERIPPPAGGDPARGRHLWVFFNAEIRYVLETAPDAVPPLTSGMAKHTNLTGGAAASCGGELWVDPANDRLLYVNGGSGRYGPKTPEQLDDAIAVFRGRGFEVVSFGWNSDKGGAARVYRP